MHQQSAMLETEYDPSGSVFSFLCFFYLMATFRNLKLYVQQLPKLGRLKPRELSPALVEQINLLLLYAVLFPYQPNPHRVLNTKTTNITTQEVLKQQGSRSQLFITP